MSQEIDFLIHKDRKGRILDLNRALEGMYPEAKESSRHVQFTSLLEEHPELGLLRINTNSNISPYVPAFQSETDASLYVSEMLFNAKIMPRELIKPIEEFGMYSADLGYVELLKELFDAPALAIVEYVGELLQLIQFTTDYSASYYINGKNRFLLLIELIYHLQRLGRFRNPYNNRKINDVYIKLLKVEGKNPDVTVRVTRSRLKKRIEQLPKTKATLALVRMLETNIPIES